MKTITKSYETVTEVVDDLAKQGYTFNFTVGDNECVVCKKKNISLAPEDFLIDEVFRFEGQTSPDDEDVVYAISSTRYNVKGVIVNSYGAYSDARVDKLLEKLQLQHKQKTKPINRHKSIIQFSREHHFGLLLTWKIRQGIRMNIPAARIAGYVLFFFEEDLRKHFNAEEKLLFEKLNNANPLVQRATSEHIAIYDLIRSIKEEEFGYEILQQFADLLDKHIRFEERVLFNYIQSKLSEEQLQLIEELHASSNDDPDQRWEDQFWTIKI